MTLVLSQDLIIPSKENIELVKTNNKCDKYVYNCKQYYKVEDRLKKDIKKPVDKLFEPTTEEVEDKNEEITKNTKGTWI